MKYIFPILHAHLYSKAQNREALYTTAMGTNHHTKSIFHSCHHHSRFLNISLLHLPQRQNCIPRLLPPLSYEIFILDIQISSALFFPHPIQSPYLSAPFDVCKYSILTISPPTIKNQKSYSTRPLHRLDRQSCHRFLQVYTRLGFQYRVSLPCL